MIELAIAGDFSYSSIKEATQNIDYQNSFGAIKHIIDECDYSIVNLESPVIFGNPTPINKFGPNLYSNSKAFDLIRYLGFKGVTLANNHFFDQGTQGINDTISLCAKNNIAYFGGGHNVQEASKTKYLELNNKLIAIINCCEIEYSIANEKHGGSNPLNPISQYYAITEAKHRADLVIVITHGGIEHFQYPTLKMQETYRFFIDAGADAVVNHHQHCFSGYEYYKEAPIVYGLGNFFFPRVKYSNTFWNFGYIAKLIINEKIQLKIYPYNQCSGDVNIIPLNSPEYNEFNQQLDRINSIISNPDSLIKINSDFMKKGCDTYDWLFQPYDNKYLKVLASKGFLPKFFSQRRLDEIMSLINCQSHYDRFNYYLKQKTTKST